MGRLKKYRLTYREVKRMLPVKKGFYGISFVGHDGDGCFEDADLFAFFWVTVLAGLSFVGNFTRAMYDWGV